MVLQRESPGGLEQTQVELGLGWGEHAGPWNCSIPHSVTPKVIATGHRLAMLVCLFQLY